MAGGAKHPETSFWKRLRTAADGANGLGAINLFGARLQSEKDGLYVAGSGAEVNTQGKISVEARPLNGAPGYILEAAGTSGANSELVYWLPWKNDAATSVKRAIYEGDCNFFMTTSLTGCRFTLTPEMVLHVANSPYANSGRSPADRTMVEIEQTGPLSPATTRVDPTHGFGDATADHAYGIHRTLVFGMKTHTGAWVYKMLQTWPAPGTWTTL